MSLDHPRISQSLIFPCSLATASKSEPGLMARAVIFPRGVDEVGQFLYTVREGKCTKNHMSLAGRKYGAELTKPQSIPFQPTCHSHQLSIWGERQMTYRRRQLIQSPPRFGSGRNFSRTPSLPIIDIDDPTRTPDGNPSISSEISRSASTTAHCNDSSSYSPFINPPPYNPPLPAVPFDSFPSSADHCHSFAISPPVEICDTAVALHAHFYNPLEGPYVQDVNQTTPTSS